MEKKTENIHPEQWLKDLPAKTEPEGFKADEMVICPKCKRTSPPTRTNCFYCGEVLPISEAQTKYIKPNFRLLEMWEKGFNVIYLPGNQRPEQDKISELAKFMNYEIEDFQKLIDAEKPLPLARVESKQEADILLKRLEDSNIKSLIISDENFKLETVTRRLRRIEFIEDKLILILFNVNEIVEVSSADLALIVTGLLFERKIEATESLKRKKENKVLDSSELSSDEFLIDIYSKNDPIGYRIEPSGFDFSCLGSEKGFLAKDNMKVLIKKIHETVPQAVFDEDYMHIRAELGKIWEVDQRSDSGAIDRKGLGGYQRKNTTTISNLTQFTRYSRLQWHLL